MLYFNIACAVGGLIVDQTGRLLLVRRAKGPSQGLLALPGGFVDPGETAEEALRREVREEVGLSVEIAAAIGSHQNAYSYKGITYPVLDFFYVCRTAGPVGNAADLTLQAAEVAGCEWRDPAGIQAHEIAFPSMHWAVERFRDSARLTAPR